jgi:hypothetical protein
MEHAAVGQLDRARRAPLEPHVVRDAGDAREPRHAVEQPRHLERVARLVTLRTRRPHRGAAPLVQHLELDPGAVGHDPHHAAERVDLAHHVTLGDPADRGVARHLGGVLGIHGEERYVKPHARTRHRRFAARVAGADHHDVEPGVAGAGGRDVCARGRCRLAASHAGRGVS